MYPKRMLLHVVAATILAGGCALARPRCDEASIPLYRRESRVITVTEAQAVTANARVKEILAVLPLPVRDACSGLYCPEWDVEDGRILIVSYGSVCERPVAVSLSDRQN